MRRAGPVRQGRPRAQVAQSDLIPIFVNAMPTPAVEPADVSSAVLFLLSDESRYVTGLQFKVDAGVTIN